MGTTRAVSRVASGDVRMIHVRNCDTPSANTKNSCPAAFDNRRRAAEAGLSDGGDTRYGKLELALGIRGAWEAFPRLVA